MLLKPKVKPFYPLKWRRIRMEWIIVEGESITNRFKSCQKEDTTNNGYLSFMTHINGSIAFSFC